VRDPRSALLQHDLVEPVAELLRQVDRLLVRARDRVDGIEPPRQPSEPAEDPSIFSVIVSPSTCAMPFDGRRVVMTPAET
jgi:hypothetical protein